ncbi:MAG: SDR family oxidoreductase [Bacillota bacterium]
MLEGRIALVTGSSRGVGRAVALELAARGADVAVHCRQSLDEARSVAARIASMGRGSVVVSGDTRSAEDVDRFVAEIRQELGEVDILVNNAAHALLKPFLEISPTEWRDQLDCKAYGYYLAARAVLPAMLERGQGVIINVLSTVGVRGGEGESGYAAANGAAGAMTRALASELGERGIRCCGVQLTWAENAFDPDDPECRLWLKRFPLGRVTRLNEIAGTVAFLASDDASGITGSIVSVDAGFMAR